MKRLYVFLIIYLGILYFMLGTFFCYELGKNHSVGEALCGMWDSTKALFPVIIICAITVSAGLLDKRKDIR